MQRYVDDALIDPAFAERAGGVKFMRLTNVIREDVCLEAVLDEPLNTLRPDIIDDRSFEPTVEAELEDG